MGFPLVSRTELMLFVLRYSLLHICECYVTTPHKSYYCFCFAKKKDMSAEEWLEASTCLQRL